MKNGIGRDFEEWTGFGFLEQEKEERLSRRNYLGINNGN